MTYRSYRLQLENFYSALKERIQDETPELLPALSPPVAVPYGYQLVPTILPDQRQTSAQRGIKISAFSWSRTEGLLDRDRRKLDSLTAKMRALPRGARTNRHRHFTVLVDQSKQLVASQKVIENQIQYNRFWQGDIATHGIWYGKLKRLQQVALERQRLKDSVPLVDEVLKAALLNRADSLTRQIEDWIKKAPTPDFVRVEHPGVHRWILRVPVYTDIEDSAFVEGFRDAIETGWRMRDGDDDFSVKLAIRRLSPSAIYPDGHVPPKGAHIDLDAHAARFPQDGVVLTTGGNTVRALEKAIILSPFPIRRGTLVHEFGHMLGFKDGYFRSFENHGPEGYEVLEVILDPHDVVAAPEAGLVRREHFDQIVRERK